MPHCLPPVGLAPTWRVLPTYFKILVWCPDLWFELYFCLLFLLLLPHQLQGQVNKKKKKFWKKKKKKTPVKWYHFQAWKHFPFGKWNVPQLGCVCAGVCVCLSVCFVLFCFVLFCFVSCFYFVLFCFVLFCFVLFCFVLFCFVLYCFSDRKKKYFKIGGFGGRISLKNNIPDVIAYQRIQQKSIIFSHKFSVISWVYIMQHVRQW